MTSHSPHSPIGQPPLARSISFHGDNYGDRNSPSRRLDMTPYGQPLALTVSPQQGFAAGDVQTQPLALTARSSAQMLSYPSNLSHGNSQPLELTVNNHAQPQPLRLTKGTPVQAQTQPLALTSTAAVPSAAVTPGTVQMVTVIRPVSHGHGGPSRMLAGQPRLAHSANPSRSLINGGGPMKSGMGESIMASPSHSQTQKALRPVLAPHGRVPIMPYNASKLVNRRLAAMPPSRQSLNNNSPKRFAILPRLAQRNGNTVIINSQLHNLSPQTLRSLAPLGRSPPSLSGTSSSPRAPTLIAHNSTISPKTQMARLPIRAIVQRGSSSSGLRTIAVSSPSSGLRGMSSFMISSSPSHRPVFVSPNGAFTVTSIPPAHSGVHHNGSMGNAYSSMPLSLVAVSASNGGGVVATNHMLPAQGQPPIDLQIVTPNNKRELKPAPAGNNGGKLRLPWGDSDTLRKNVTTTDIGNDVESNVDVSSFDPAKVMEWKDGIGTLPGSDIKFQINELGLLEMVTDDDDVTVLQSDNGKSASISADQELKQELSNESPQNGKAIEPIVIAPQDPVVCGHCGVAVSPSKQLKCLDGKFCSHKCIDAFRAQKSRQKISNAALDKSQSFRALPTKRGRKRRETEKPDEESATNKKVAKLSTGVAATVATSVNSANSESSTGDASKTVKKTKGFDWADYLTQEKAIAAPAKLFKESQSSVKNSFRIGMRLEGIDPNHPSLYCVLTVRELHGARLRLHFDGYSECYDFWINCDSPFIFPVGWAERNGKTLQPPKGYTTDNFVWADYLKSCKATAAPKHCFNNTPVNGSTPHSFRVGAKLEAVDKKNNALTCVATVTDVLGDRLLVHFDGWEDVYDYWCDPTSPYIHPVGWCQETGKPLSPPNNWKDIESFTWDEYLAQTKSQAVPARAFKLRPANEFETGMRLEAVDKRNTILIRVATICDVEPYRIKIHFDGWADSYDYWVDDDSMDIHPPGWCHKVGHSLTLPPSMNSGESSNQSGCPTPGCTGVGHMKGAKFTGHHSIVGCPYSSTNMHKETILPDRVVTVFKPHYATEPMETETALTSSKSSLLTVKCSALVADVPNRFSGTRLSGGSDGQIVPMVTLPNGTVRPLYGKGSGRGRKKKNIMKLIQQQKEIDAKAKSVVLSTSKSMSPKSVSPANGTCDVATSGSLYERVHESVFQPLLAIRSTARDLPVGWDEHSRLLPGVDKYTVDEVSTWNVDKVSQFVASLPGCNDIAKHFANELIDGEAFLLLTQADIVKIMNVKLGPAIKIYNSILVIKSNTGN